MRKRRHWAKLLTQYHTAGEWWRQNSKAAILAPRSQQLYSTTAHSLQPIETGLLSAPSCSSETFQQVHQWLLPCQHKGPSVFILSIMQYPIKVTTFLFCYTSLSLVTYIPLFFQPQTWTLFFSLFTRSSSETSSLVTLNTTRMNASISTLGLSSRRIPNYLFHISLRCITNTFYLLVKINLLPSNSSLQASSTNTHSVA